MYDFFKHPVTFTKARLDALRPWGSKHKLKAIGLGVITAYVALFVVTHLKLVTTYAIWFKMLAVWAVKNPIHGSELFFPLTVCGIVGYATLKQGKKKLTTLITGVDEDAADEEDESASKSKSARKKARAESLSEADALVDDLVTHRVFHATEDSPAEVPDRHEEEEATQAESMELMHEVAMAAESHESDLVDRVA